MNKKNKSKQTKKKNIQLNINEKKDLLKVSNEEYIKITENMGYGVPIEYPCLTSNGWKFFDKLNSDDMIYVYNVETDKINYVPFQCVNVTDHNGDIFNLKGRFLDVFISPKGNILKKKKENTNLIIQPIKDLNFNDLINNSIWEIPVARNKEFVYKEFQSSKNDFILNQYYFQILAFIFMVGFYNKENKYFIIDLVKSESCYYLSYALKKIKNIPYIKEKIYDQKTNENINRFIIKDNDLNIIDMINNDLTDINKLIFKTNSECLKSFIDIIKITNGISSFINQHKIETICGSMRVSDYGDILQSICVLTDEGCCQNIQDKKINRFTLFNKNTVKVIPERVENYNGKLWYPENSYGTFICLSKGFPFICAY